jgi:hypothetical protein
MPGFRASGLMSFMHENEKKKVRKTMHGNDITKAKPQNLSQMMIL